VAKSGSLVNIVRALATAEQLMSHESSQVSPPSGSDSDQLTSPASATSDQATLSPRPKSAFCLRDEMRVRDLTLPQHHDASERSVSPTSTASHADSGTVDALLDVMDVHAERQLIKATELSDQLETVQNDVRNVNANVRVAILGREEDSRHLAEIHTAVDEVRSALVHLDAQQHGSSSTEITQAVDERLRSNQAEIFQALEVMQAMLRTSTLNSTGSMLGEQPSTALPDGHSSGGEHIDLTDIGQKLDMLVKLFITKSGLASSGLLQGPQLDSSEIEVRSILSSTSLRNMY